MEQNQELQPKPFLIYRDGELQNKADLFIFQARQLINRTIQVAGRSVEVGGLVVNHIIASAEG